MDGPGKLYGELDNASLATVVTGMDAHAPGDDGRSTSQRRADGLVAMAAHRCPDDARAIDNLDADGDAAEAPDDGGAAVGEEPATSPRPTRHRRLDRALPAFDVIVDTRDVSVTAAGTIC